MIKASVYNLKPKQTNEKIECTDDNIYKKKRLN